MSQNSGEYEKKFKDLEQQLSELKLQLEETYVLLKQEQERRQFYQMVADFAFGWELWIEPDQNIKYCSPSCGDITGYTANQVIASESITDLLIYSADQDKFEHFITQALDQVIIGQSLEFRIITRTKQLRWCLVNVRGVYNTEGRYLGIRASIQDITKLKLAMGHIHQLSEKKELEARNRERLSSELEIKERELVSFLLQLSQKNELIAAIQRTMYEMDKGNAKQNQQHVKQIINLLESTTASPIDWEMINVQLEKLYPGFLKNLVIKHKRLTEKEKKLCASLRLGLTSKEIAGLSNITPQSVEVARVRLRKKLNVPREIRLTQYLERF